MKKSGNPLEKSCWKGYKKEGTKTKNAKEVNNCVPDKKKKTDWFVVKFKLFQNKLCKWNSICKFVENYICLQSILIIDNIELAKKDVTAL